MKESSHVTVSYNFICFSVSFYSFLNYSLEYSISFLLYLLKLHVNHLQATTYRVYGAREDNEHHGMEHNATGGLSNRCSSELYYSWVLGSPSGFTSFSAICMESYPSYHATNAQLN